MFTRSL